MGIKTVGERAVEWLAEMAWTPAAILPEDGQECWTALSDGSVTVHQFRENYANAGPSWQAMEKCGQNLLIEDSEFLRVTHWQPFVRPVAPEVTK